MLPILSNLAGLWAFLGVPLLVLIHCLQQRSRTENTSTLFLLEALAPESHGGRSWDWLRLSRAFWLQVAAVLLATWILVGPRWVRGESAQTVAIVLDSAVAMSAFRDEAVRAAEVKIAASAGRAAHTDWLILSSDPRVPPLYRGPLRANAELALNAWRPRLGTHDYEPALRLARSLTSGAGETWFITDSLLKVPSGQPAVGVGTPLANVGFAGVTVFKDESGWRWRALVKNHSASVIRREWWLENAGNRSAVQTVEIPAGGLVELSGKLPDGASEATLTLKPDAFTADDRLPVLRPRPKQLVAFVSLEGDEGAFFKKLLTGIDGVTLGGGVGGSGVSGAGGAGNSGSVFKPQLRVERLEATGKVNPPAGAAIFLPRSVATEDKRLMTLPVVPQRNALVADLNWQGLLGPGASNLKLGDGDDALLWQAGKPLAWLRPGASEARQLVLNIDWAGGNASRLPAMVLLLRRFVESVRAAQPGFYAESFDAGGSVPIAARDREPIGAGGSTVGGGGTGAILTFEPSAGGEKSEKQVTALTDAQLAVLRAPGEAGFFTLSRGGRDLVRGAVQFADARQSDFSKAEIFDTGRGPESKAAWERATRPDPWVPAWLLLLGGLLMASWWPFGRRTGGVKQ